MRLTIAFVLLLAACGRAPQATEILWDTWGVPHIYATNDAEAFKAFGYAQAASHANLILKLYGQARGRAAEYWGEANLPTDRFVRTMGIPERAAAWYVDQTPEFKADLDAFAAGFNHYAEQHPDQIADSVKQVLPVSATDLLAHAQRIVNFLFMVGGQVDLPKTMDVGGGPGSNMWAVGPRRSASGHSLLIQNPHLPWNDLYLFYEAHIVTPTANLYGATLVGFPTLAIGFNDYLGWSHTVNTQDAVDVYRLTKDGDTGYRYDGGTRMFDTRTEVVKVKTVGGALREDTLTIKGAVHGPVFDEAAATASAVRVAGLDDSGNLEAWWRMGNAKGLAEFEAVVKELHIPFFNIMYADRDGHIYYFFGGKTPIRSRGDVAFWSQPVRGDSSALLWTEYLPYEKLPHITDPPSGWLQNANDPPWTVTWPLAFNPDSFPAYLAPREMGFRPERSALMQSGDSSITFDELVAYKHDTHMALADRLLPELLTEARHRGDAKAKEAADVLEKWDRAATATSRGTMLFTTWAQEYRKLARSKVFARAWRLDSALTTPAGLGDPVAAVKALSVAAAQVEKDHGALDVAWGDVVRLRYGGQDLAGNGAPGDPFGVFRTAYPSKDKDGKWSISGGDTYYGLIEFGNPLRAKILMAYGNSSQPGSKHFGDQIPLFSRQELRDAWRTRAEVESHLESREAVK